MAPESPAADHFAASSLGIGSHSLKTFYTNQKLSCEFILQRKTGSVGCPFCEELLQERYDSRASCIWGNCSLAFARDFTTSPSAFSDVRLRAVAISLTRRYLARSNIFF